MRLDNDGEGGILALLALVGEDEKRRARRYLIFVGIFGAALLYGDGIITPAISVLSAVEGLSTATQAFTPFLLPITVVILALLFLFQPMRYDEAYTFTHFASTPLYLALSNYSSTNNHLLNTLLVHFSYILFGNHPWALRLPTLIAGWLLVPGTYLVTRTFFGKHAALLAAALVASSSALILFSANARGYTLMALFFLLLPRHIEDDRIDQDEDAVGIRADGEVDDRQTQVDADLGRGKTDPGSRMAGLDHVGDQAGQLRGFLVDLDVLGQQTRISVSDQVPDHGTGFLRDPCDARFIRPRSAPRQAGCPRRLSGCLPRGTAGPPQGGRRSS
jgi:hypothetical protein